MRPLQLLWDRSDRRAWLHKSRAHPRAICAVRSGSFWLHLAGVEVVQSLHSFDGPPGACTCSELGAIRGHAAQYAVLDVMRPQALIPFLAIWCIIGITIQINNNKRVHYTHPHSSTHVRLWHDLFPRLCFSNIWVYCLIRADLLLRPILSHSQVIPVQLKKFKKNGSQLCVYLFPPEETEIGYWIPFMVDRTLCASDSETMSVLRRLLEGNGVICMSIHCSCSVRQHVAFDLHLALEQILFRKKRCMPFTMIYKWHDFK